MKSRHTVLVLALASMMSWSHAQQMSSGGPEASKALEDLLLCKPSQLFNRKKAERAFKRLGLVMRPDGGFVPASGQVATVFGVSVRVASISDESDQAELTVTVNNRSADELAQQLSVKKQRVNGPTGPELAYRKATGKRSSLEIRPDSPNSSTIECVSW